jgi:hypothetical protein
MVRLGLLQEREARNYGDIGYNRKDSGYNQLVRLRFAAFNLGPAPILPAITARSSRGATLIRPRLEGFKP